MSGKANKFGAIKTTVDNIVFSSKKEAARFAQLKLLEKGGVIRGLELQPKFAIAINGIHCFNYLADFAYFEGKNRIVEDVKSGPTKTPVYRLKKKCVEAAYSIQIKEV